MIFVLFYIILYCIIVLSYVSELFALNHCCLFCAFCSSTPHYIYSAARIWVATSKVRAISVVTGDICVVLYHFLYCIILLSYVLELFVLNYCCLFLRFLLMHSTLHALRGEEVRIIYSISN